MNKLTNQAINHWISFNFWFEYVWISINCKFGGLNFFHAWCLNLRGHLLGAQIEIYIFQGEITIDRQESTAHCSIERCQKKLIINQASSILYNIYIYIYIWVISCYITICLMLKNAEKPSKWWLNRHEISSFFDVFCVRAPRSEICWHSCDTAKRTPWARASPETQQTPGNRQQVSPGTVKIALDPRFENGAWRHVRSLDLYTNNIYIYTIWLFNIAMENHHF